MRKLLRNRWTMVLFLSFIYLVEPFITGYLAGLRVAASVYTGNIGATPRVIERNLSGSQVHSLMWSFPSGGTIAVELGVEGAGAEISAAPAGVGPFTIVGGTPAIEPLFLPVAQTIKLTISGSPGDGVIAIIDS